MPNRTLAHACALIALLAPAAAWAQDAGGDDPICTDRPTKAGGACTVAPGRIQVEADLINGTFQRQHGVTTDTWLAAYPLLKLGLTQSSDVEVQWTPLQWTRVHTDGGPDKTAGGPSDLYLRFKQRFVGDADSDLQIGVIPFLKAPTASHLNSGNGAWEGGAQVPINLKLGKDWQLTLQPELDVNKDEDRDDHHLTTQQVISLARMLPRGWTVSADLWGQWSFERGGTTQSSFDLSVAKLVGKDLQLDAAVYLGLNRQTPGAVAYLGVSRRF